MFTTCRRVLVQAQRILRHEKRFHIFGIETSCDETGCAIVDDTGKIVSDTIWSQQLIHLMNGGIIPPIARDYHLKHLKEVAEATIAKSQLSWAEIDAIAVTVKPGLPLSLLVGLNHAKDLSFIHRKPLLPIHHMEAHALTIRMVRKVPFPFLVLLISGGNCLLVLAQDVDKFLLLGECLDNAPGEVLDKVARRLKLRNIKKFSKMGGGAAVELAAQQGDPLAYDIPGPLVKYRDCNFSFAGIKTFVKWIIEREEKKHGIAGDMVLPEVYDICASFQWAVTKHLCWRVQRATEYLEMNNLMPQQKNLVVSGGVASNTFIRTMLTELCHNLEYDLLVPPPQLCTDNGIMIAWNGVEKWRLNRGIIQPDDLAPVDISAKCQLGENVIGAVTEAHIKCQWVKLNPRSASSIPSGKTQVRNQKAAEATSSNT